MRNRIRRVVALAWSAATWLWMLPNAMGQEGSAYDRDSLTREGFVPAPTGGGEDAIRGGPLLLAAYLALWLMLGFYLWRLVRRQREVARELSGLSTAIRDLDERLESVQRRGSL